MTEQYIGLTKLLRAIELKEICDKPYICTICGNTFSLLSNLTKHIDEVHYKMRPFECHHCNRKFSRRHSVKRHIQLKHDFN